MFSSVTIKKQQKIHSTVVLHDMTWYMISKEVYKTPPGHTKGHANIRLESPDWNIYIKIVHENKTEKEKTFLVKLVFKEKRNWDNYDYSVAVGRVASSHWHHGPLPLCELQERRWGITSWDYRSLFLFFSLFVLDNPKWDLTFEGTYTQTYATVRHIMLKNELRMDKEKRLLNA